MLEPAVERDPGPDAQREGVAGVVGVAVVESELDAGHQEQAVLLSRPPRLPVDRIEIALVCRLRQVRGSRREHVVGDAEHVEAVAAVDIDELGQRERAVAPRRVRVELTEKRFPVHAPSVAAPDREPGEKSGERAGKKRRTLWPRAAGATHVQREGAPGGDFSAGRDRESPPPARAVGVGLVNAAYRSG